ncbi:MAG: response regulator [Thermodesulfobacteriota bacterium]|nr:response regulator [Thermodesulfobacteriota bacterium]
MASILIIDDDIQFRGMLREMLKLTGYDVEEASNGKEGMRLYKENPFDLIITDIIMPEQEGIETIIELRRSFPDVKIIAISGGGRINAEDHLQMAKALGAIQTLTKPFGREKLVEAINKAIIGDK